MNEDSLLVTEEPLVEQSVCLIQEGTEKTISVVQEIIDSGFVPPYSGSYEFTPTEDTQTISIADHKALQNIIIKPIPTSYGRVEWNGTTLTIT